MSEYTRYSHGAVTHQPQSTLRASGHVINHSPSRVSTVVGHHDQAATRIVITPGGSRREVNGDYNYGASVDRFGDAFRSSYTDGHNRVISQGGYHDGRTVVHGGSTGYSTHGSTVVASSYGSSEGRVELTIKSANFFKDADAWGKQDPFIQFRYAGRLMKTTTKDNAGKNAQWNETFTLDNIHNEIKNGGSLRLEALDDDTMSDDWLGATQPISYSEFTRSSGDLFRTLDLLSKNGKQIGSVDISTQFISLGGNVVQGAIGGYLHDTVLRQSSPVIHSDHRASRVVSSGQHYDTGRVVSHGYTDAHLGATRVVSDSHNLRASRVVHQSPTRLNDSYHHGARTVVHGGSTGYSTHGSTVVGQSYGSSEGRVELTIKSANFFKDSDTWGKQDPFIQFRYAGRLMKTTTKDNAGKNAQWNETFTLDNIHREISNGGSLRLEALDDDTTSDDWLGATQPISYSEFTRSSGDLYRTLDLLSKNGQKVGSVEISTQFVSLAGAITSQIGAHVQDQVLRQSSPTRIVSSGHHYDTGRVVSHGYTDSHLGATRVVSDSHNLRASRAVPAQPISRLNDSYHHGARTVVHGGSTGYSTHGSTVVGSSYGSSEGRVELTIKSAQFLEDSDTWGKQDPFIQFRYAGRILKTTVKDNAGKNAQWNETFTLDNINREISNGGSLRLEALDDDTMSDDWLGATQPISYSEFTRSSGDLYRKLDLLNKAGRLVGTVEISTQYIQLGGNNIVSQIGGHIQNQVFRHSSSPSRVVQSSLHGDQNRVVVSGNHYNQSPSRVVQSQLSNGTARIELTIKSAKFYEDADAWGKQDPFIQFKYDGKLNKTSVKDDAGKNAKWNEKFTLDNVQREIAAGRELILEALDDDTLSDDWLGQTIPIAFSELVKSAAKIKNKLKILDKSGQEIGYVKISSRYFQEGGYTDRNVIGSSITGYLQNQVIRHESPTRIVSSGQHYDTGRVVSHGYTDSHLGASRVVSNSNNLRASRVVHQSPTRLNDSYARTSVVHGGSTGYSTQGRTVVGSSSYGSSEGRVELTIKSANFFKDSDFWGKQDPFIQFRYAGRLMKTTTKDNAGKNAQWNETFTLDNIHREISNGGSLRLEALDDDTTSDDWLGATQPISYSEFTRSSGDLYRTLDLLSKNGQKVGSVEISTQFVSLAGAITSQIGAHVQDQVLRQSSPTRIVSSGHHYDTGRVVSHGLSDSQYGATRIVSDHNLRASNVVSHGYTDSHNLRASRVVHQSPTRLNESYHQGARTVVHGGSTGYSTHGTTVVGQSYGSSEGRVELTIKSANFFKDSDTWGKQDPFIQFRYAGRLMKTTTKDNAGKNAQWNETFTLDNIHREISNGGSLRLEALDDDTTSDDWLGATQPISYSEFTRSSGDLYRTLDLLSKNGQKVGSVEISTQFVSLGNSITQQMGGALRNSVLQSSPRGSVRSTYDVVSTGQHYNPAAVHGAAYQTIKADGTVVYGDDHINRSIGNRVSQIIPGHSSNVIYR